MSRASRWVDWVLGTDERMRPRTRLTLITDGLYCFWLLCGALALHEGMLGRHEFKALCLVLIGPRLLFYPLVRSGRTLKLADAGLTQLQMGHACACIAFMYPHLPELRAALLQCMCLVQVFGLFTLRPRQTLTMGMIGAGSLLGLLAYHHVHPLPRFEMPLETLRLGISSFIVLVLALMSRGYALIRVDVRKSKQELAQAVARVNDLVTHDILTGMYNRQHMQELLAGEMARFKRCATPFCVAIIDLDHFKQVNDTYGHHVGDEVLIRFAEATRKVLRCTDVAARWGGEEFFVLLPDTPTSAASLIVLERLRQQLLQMPVSSGQPSLRVSFSAGIAQCQTEEKIDHLLERADRALYVAKASGRNRCALAESALPDSNALIPASV